MATVFMKWLEQKPDSYDRGIRLLTLGRINRIRDDLVKKFIRNTEQQKHHMFIFFKKSKGASMWPILVLSTITIKMHQR